MHHYIEPHFWDANVLNLRLEIMPKWLMEYQELYEGSFAGPVPCVDWCDDGGVLEYPGPCTTQPPTTPVATTTTAGTPPTTTPTTTTISWTEDCDDACYKEWLNCLGGCSSGDSVCQSNCGRDHYECLTICEDEKETTAAMETVNQNQPVI